MSNSQVAAEQLAHLLPASILKGHGMRFSRTLFVVALLAALSACGGGGSKSGTTTAPSSGTTLPIAVAVSGAAVPIGNASPEQDIPIAISAGQDLELTTTKTVTWTMEAGNGSMAVGEGTLHLGGMAITQKTVTTTKWSASIGGASLTSQPATQTFRIIAKSDADGSVIATVAVQAALPPSSASGWQPVTSLGKTRAMAIDPADPQTLYVQTASGIYKLANGGATWTTLNKQLTSFLAGAIAIDPTNNKIIYAGSDHASGLQKSTDGGVTWTAINNGLPALAFGEAIDGIAINPVNPQVVYVSIGFPTSSNGKSGVYMTTNGGANWSATTLTANVRVLAMDPSNPSVLYAGADAASGLLWKSTDAGATWCDCQLVSSALDASSIVSALVVSKANPQAIYLATTAGPLYKSTDGGTTWTTLPFPAAVKGITSLAVDPGNPALVYAGTSSGAIFRSNDGGLNWVDISKGQTSGSSVNALVIDPGNPLTVYAGTFGLYKTFSGGL